MSIAKQEFTNAGRSMLGRAQNGEVLHISKLVAGSGSATQPSDLWPLTQCKVEEHLFNISAKRDYGQGTMLVEGSFRSDQVGTAFLLRELGVLAHIGTEADRLYSVANVFAVQPDNVDPASPSVHTFKIKLIIDRIPTANLVVQLGPTEAVLGENVGADTVGAGVYRDAAGNVLYFKRLVEGTGMEIVDNPDTVYIGISTLKNNLDLYVPTNYPGISDPKVLFASVQAAHDYLLQFIIPADKFATIHVGPTGTGLHTTGPITFSHPNSKQISLLGYPRVDKPVSVINWLDNTPSGAAIGSAWPNITHSAGHKNCALTDVSGLAVGQIVYLAGCQTGWAGGCKITAINTTTKVVTVDVPCQGTQAPYVTQSVLAGQRLSYYPSVLVWDDPTPGQRASKHCLAFPNGINLVENILAVNGYSAFGGTESINLTNCQAYGAITGAATLNGMVILGNDFVASNCETGIGGPGQIFCPYMTMLNGCLLGIAPGASGNALAAINPSMTTAWMYIHHCQCAMRAWFGASVRGGHLIVQQCDLGLDVYSGSTVELGILANGFYDNGLPASWDIWCRGHSYVLVKLGGGPDPARTSPIKNTAGNSNSWIDIVP